MARKPLSKKTRFDVFKRDGFTCQYCGKSAPDVILEVDHIQPIKAGGSDNIMNLITSCKDCNRGKGAKKLTENESLKKQMEQLKEINIRREQLEMLVQWRTELSNLSAAEVNAIEARFIELTGSSFTEHGKESMRKYINKYGFKIVSDSLEASFNQYAVRDGEKFTDESMSKVFNMIPRIASVKIEQEKHPYLKDVFYCRAVLKNRLRWLDERRIIPYLKQAVKNGADTEDLKDLCRTVNSWWSLLDTLRDVYGVDC